MKKAVEHEVKGEHNFNWGPLNGSEKLGKEIRRVGNWRRNQDHRNYSVSEIGQNIENRLEDLRRLAVTQTPVKDCHLMLVQKTLKGVK